MAFEIDNLLSKDKKTIKEVETKKAPVASSKKMGRPKKTIKADNKISCYLTEEENKKFELIAEEEVISKSALARKIIIQYLKEV